MEDDEGIMIGGNITPCMTPRRNADGHTSPPFSQRSIASTTDGVKSNDGNNSIMNNLK